MNPTRLFVLAALDQRGPLHGHQIRRDARVGRTDLWSEVKPGSLYGALHRLHDEGLIEEVRREQHGNMPARTVYAITAEGRRELKALREEAYRDVEQRPDPVDLALASSGELDEDTLRGFVEDRIAALEARRALVRHESERAQPGQSVIDALILGHASARIDADLQWHHTLLEQAGKITAENATRQP
ncbi:PadR family transcriptional regulator [Flexivirga caeni]|uniref:PadR family transcriptional regulator n=1 Tax=Flexivirga caeni TaxID=2294115 RepID=A0A3M9MG55_9MICO|nr:PadR family transcriptional regulator [Flexivirga caeni]RNI23873.1 PadR family transcriptional regulator [Flexivirga caeni]